MILTSIISVFAFWISFFIGKNFGFSKGLKYFKKRFIHRSADGHEHYCNVSGCNVVCFERENELWVKEYCAPNEKEGRTYMVFHCPWCGYQTERSKVREKNERRN